MAGINGIIVLLINKQHLDSIDPGNVHDEQRDQHVAARNHCFDPNDPGNLIPLILSVIPLIPGLIQLIPEVRLRT